MTQVLVGSLQVERSWIVQSSLDALSAKLLTQLIAVIEEHHIEKSYDFSDFVSALEFVKAVGAVAEEQGHHPDILLRWGKVTVTIWTHKIDGLTESDFILAAKLDEIPRPQAH